MTTKIHHVSALVFLAIFGALTYSNALHGPLMFEDHDVFIDSNKDLRKIPSFFLPDNGLGKGQEYYFRPLLKVIPMLLNVTFGTNVTAYHTINLVLWVLASWLLFILLNSFLGSSATALGAALLFLIHPINGSVVNLNLACVCSIEVILMFLSLYFLVLPPDFLTIHLPYVARCFVSLVFFLLALLCYESALTLPFYAMIILIFGKDMKWKEALKESLPLWGMMAVYFVWHLYFANATIGLWGHFSQFAMDPFEYLATEIKLLFWYLKKLFLPFDVVVTYTSPVLRGAVVGGWLTLGIGTIAFLLFYWNRCSKITRLGMVWFLFGLMPLLPASLVQPSRQVLILEAYWFIFASIGFFLVIANLLFQWWHKSRIGALMTTFVLALVLIVSSRITNEHWSDEVGYCQYWLKQSPTFSAIHTLMGRAYLLRGLFPQARQEFRLGLTNSPQDVFNYFMSTGLMDLNQDNFNRAGEEFTQALKINPQEPMVYNDLGAVYFKLGQIEMAQRLFAQALQLDPKEIFSYLNMGKVYLNQGRPEEAINAFREVLSISPGNKAAIRELASMGMQAQENGDMVLAQRIYKLLMQMAPGGIGR